MPYHYEVNFHNQLKAKLLDNNIITQVIREGTIDLNNPNNNLMESAIAWNLSTTAFYKSGGRPWKLSGIRDGVCYIGLAFKRNDLSSDTTMACCAAQMFLDSGDGVVFKGAVGPWYNPVEGEFHLKRNSAKDLVNLAVKSYQIKKGQPPKELFLHGKIRFNNEEWEGFKEGAGSSTNLIGVRIKNDNNLKLFRKGNHPILRGLAFIQNKRTAFLWTKGFTPRLQTYPGREIPNPILIDINRGDFDIKVVLSDILALTKLNYNSCIFADGFPVTIRFADAIGEILTAGPVGTVPPLPFKYYI